MSESSPRANLTNVVAACILSGGLIAAAIINSHRPTVVAPGGAPVVVSAALPTPPIDQDSAKEQIKRQVLSSPVLQNLSSDGHPYGLLDVTVTTLDYRAKDDQFDVVFDTVWKAGAPLPPPVTGMATLSNDGYGHYTGAVSLTTTAQEPNLVDVMSVTIR